MASPTKLTAEQLSVFYADITYNIQPTVSDVRLLLAHIAALEGESAEARTPSIMIGPETERDDWCHHQHPMGPPGRIIQSHPMSEPCLLRESALRAQLARVEAERDDLRLRLTTISHMHHFPDEECKNAECVICGVLDCRWAEPLHYHHDSCPAEYCVERERDDARKALRAQVQAAEGLREALEVLTLSIAEEGHPDVVMSIRAAMQSAREALAAYDKALKTKDT